MGMTPPRNRTERIIHLVLLGFLAAFTAFFAVVLAWSAFKKYADFSELKRTQPRHDATVISAWDLNKSGRGRGGRGGEHSIVAVLEYRHPDGGYYRVQTKVPQVPFSEANGGLEPGERVKIFLPVPGEPYDIIIDQWPWNTSSSVYYALLAAGLLSAAMAFVGAFLSGLRKLPHDPR